MDDRVQAAAITLSLMLLLVVLELVRRRKLTEEYSFLWILSSLAILVLSMRREILQVVGRWLGVSNDPALVPLVLIVGMVCVASLCFSVIVSRQRQQIERLMEETAILSAELRDLRAESHGHGPNRPAA
jgi:hypothetical protein